MKVQIKKSITLLIAPLFLLAITSPAQIASSTVLREPVAKQLANSKNKVAILPLGYTGDGSEAKTNTMPLRLQEMTVNYLSASAHELKIMDGLTVNAILLRNGIDETTIPKYTPGELAAILEVEYIIMGSVTEDKGNITTVYHNSSEQRERAERDRRGIKIRQRSEEHGASTTMQEVDTYVSLAIYNNEGEKIYGHTRKAFFSNPGVYKYTLQYLLKRTPLYER